MEAVAAAASAVDLEVISSATVTEGEAVWVRTVVDVTTAPVAVEVATGVAVSVALVAAALVVATASQEATAVATRGPDTAAIEAEAPAAPVAPIREPVVAPPLRTAESTKRSMASAAGHIALHLPPSLVPGVETEVAEEDTNRA